MRLLLTISLLLLPCVVSAQSWEAGGSAGYGLPRDVRIASPTVSGRTGTAPGWAFGAVLGNEGEHHVGGEVRYTFRVDDLRLKVGQVTARAGAESHSLHYDVLIHATSKRSYIRPFMAVGAGIRNFRGTDPTSPSQPFIGMARFTNATQNEPLISVGAGLKSRLSQHSLLRVDFRDYATPFPGKLIVPSGGATVKGWLHDFVLMLGVSAIF